MTYEDMRYMSFAMLTAQEWWRLKLQTTSIGDMPIFVKREMSNTFVDERAEIGAGTIIFPNCVIMGKVTIGKNCVIMPGVALIGEDAKGGDNGKIWEMCLGNGCFVYPNITLLNVKAGNGVALGLPYQKNSEVGDDSVIGSLAEFNRVRFGKAVKDVHHSYLGDAEIGDDSNVGAGFITANYDGRNKHKTIFGYGCFLGVNANVIAPNEFPEGTLIAAGSTVPANLKERQQVLPFSSIIARAKKVIIRARKILAK